MTWVDYCILAVTLLSFVIGLLRGFTREVLSLLTWIFAFAGAVLLGDAAQQLLIDQISDAALRAAVASGAVFLVVLLLGAIVTHLIAQAVRESRFSAPDRTLGGGVGLLRAAAISIIFVLIAGRLGASEDRWWQQSLIVPHLTGLARGAETLVPERWLQLLTRPASSSTSSSRD